MSAPVTPVTLDGALSAEAVAAIAAGASVALDPDALARVERNRAALEELIGAGTPIYGITTGFGALLDSAVAPASRHQLQVNLLRSHAAGSGEELPPEVVRAALAIRLNSLLLAHSGVRRETLERIAELLNAGFAPCVPQTGSLGASGDLAPSAHAFLPLIGEGEVRDRDGRLLPGAEALAALGRAPLALDTKEGLALVNGTHFMAAIGTLLTARVGMLLDTADVAAALSVDALSGATPAFDARVHALRPLPGQVTSAANVRALLRGSRRARAAGDGGSLQDAYSLRCAAQVHGAAREGFGFFARLVAVDRSAVTDNPLVFDGPDAAVISAGNFHGQSLALAFDTLKLALADLGSISERRTFRLVSPSLNGTLPGFLTPDPGLSSGYMIVQYTTAAVVAELRALAHPVSVDTVPTSDNQEDHVSMGMTAALMALEAAERLERVLAAELLCGCQALDCEPAVAASPASRRAHALVRERIEPLTADRPPAPDLAAIAALVRSGAFAAVLAAAHDGTGVPA
ncbi:histidine ammonia-lyase [Conexibacter woesei]|uniref:Histidine ammonia-lyase n=1 Tax=Conexibacter woesei (strain DSM 14684 / CCUG 47730 / CIP 108061 / JCM 11494 / NBRC 100937 / ID131577) TaxID=469383 RepID=D3F196_CONWI|nr:histidine ammonia-lyase [Conexibacter woesei]ADB52059.1 histidine ammonia-lyase [Conexibacter woesei DSM 14684]